MEQPNFVNESVDRVTSVFRSLDGELRRVQKQLQTRRRSFDSRRRLEARQSRFSGAVRYFPGTAYHARWTVTSASTRPMSSFPGFMGNSARRLSRYAR